MAFKRVLAIYKSVSLRSTERQAHAHKNQQKESLIKINKNLHLKLLQFDKTFSANKTASKMRGWQGVNPYCPTPSHFLRCRFFVFTPFLRLLASCCGIVLTTIQGKYIFQFTFKIKVLTLVFFLCTKYIFLLP